MENRLNSLVNEWLVLSYQSGNKAALNLLVKRWHRPLIKKILIKIQNLEAAKDIAQDCWVVVINSIYRLNNPADFGGWLMKIASNKSIDWLRKKGVEQKYLANALDNNELSDENPDHRMTMIRNMQVAFDQLSLKDRKIIYMHYSMGLTIKDISEKLNISEGTVKSRLFTARENLKNKINKL